MSKQYAIYNPKERVFFGSAGPLIFASLEEAAAHIARLQSQEALRGPANEYVAVAVPAR